MHAAADEMRECDLGEHESGWPGHIVNYPAITYMYTCHSKQFELNPFNTQLTSLPMY